MIPLKLTMIGCGKVGGPTADLLQSLGHDVRRYDTNWNAGHTHQHACTDRDLILIAVPTPHAAEYDGSSPISGLEPRDFDYTILQQAVSAASHVAPRTPIVIISTCLPGTTRRLFSDTTNEIIYNPFLISMGAVKHDLENPDIVIIGSKDGDHTLAINQLKSLHSDMSWWNGGKVCMGTWEEAESIKIFYNTFISAKLSLVNMIQDVAQRLGNINVDVVTHALQSATMRIAGPKYMTAGMGDGGPCHPRDNIALRWLAQELDLGYDLFSAIMHAREQQAKNMAIFLVDLQASNGHLPIYIHGKSFKPGVPFCDGSYSLLVGSYIKNITGQDPLYVDVLAEVNNPDEICGIVLLAHNNDITYDNRSTGSQAQYCKFLPGTIVVDPWRTFTSQDKNVRVIGYGNTRSSA